MNQTFCKRYFLIDRKRIADLRFLLESYDGIAFVRSLDGKKGLVEIAYPPSRSVDAEALVASLVIELAMEEVEAPAAGDYPGI